MALSQVQDADWDDDSFLRLYLTTLAGTVIQMKVPVSIHHTWAMLEEYLVEHLPRNSPIETFGCELTSINEAKAFHSTVCVRHVILDAGFSTISPQAWRCCHSLRVVKLRLLR